MQLRISRMDYCTRSRGALAWNGFMAFGMIYWLIPRMTKDLCFLNWQISTFDWNLRIILYTIPMYVAGFFYVETV
jgi:cytochrome c oxidase cbb3-type subunit I/II